MDIHASGRTDNSNYYLDDSRDRYSNFRNSVRRGRTRFSSDDDDRNYFRRGKINDRTRDRDLNYLNREAENRAARSAGNPIFDRNADRMRRHFSDLYRNNARRNLGGLREEDFTTPQPRNQHDRSRNMSHRNYNRNKRSRSNSSNTSSSTISSDNGVQRALEKMQKCITPKLSSSKFRKAKEQDSRSKVLKAPSLQQELGSKTVKKVKKSMELFMSTGPPMLNDNENPQGFFKW